MANTFNLGNGDWAQNTESILAYNAENNNYKPILFDFDRESTATRVNKAGLIETINIKKPRIDFLNNTKGHLLLEPARTNSLPESENFGTNWFIIGLSVSSGISSPDGGTNAYSLIEGTGTGGKIIYDTISVSAGSVTYSLFMKKGDKKYTALLLSGVVSTSMFNVDLENGTGTTVTGSFDSTNIEEYPNGWYRVSVTATATAGNLNCNVYLMNGSTYNDRNYTGNGTDKTYIFGAQLEAGSYATSYIPTSGSAVTRPSDTTPNNSVASSIIGQTEGVIFLDFENYSQIGTTYGDYFKIQSNGNTDRVSIQGDGSTLNRLILVVNNGSSTFFQPRTIIPTGRNKVAIRYKSGLVASFINGVKIDTSATAFSFANTLNTIQIQKPNKINEARIYNEALNDAEIQALTS